MTKRTAKHTRIGSLKTWGGRMALLTATLLMLATALEVGTRTLTNASPPTTLRDAKIGARHPFSYEGDFYVDEIGKEVRLRFNNVGFRGPSRTFQKRNGTVRVAIMGDSMIAALAMPEPKMMTSKLEQMLNESHPEVDWEVMNFGVSGASTAQQIALYREVVHRFDPDVVLSCFFVGNDLTDNSPRLSRNPRVYFDFDEEGNYRQLPHSASRSKMSQWLNVHSRFYVWQKRAMRLARGGVRKATGGLQAGDWIYATEENDDLTHAWKLTSKAIETLNQEVISRGSIFGVVVVPSAPQIYTDLFEDLVTATPEHTKSFDIQHPERRLRKLCDRLGAECWTIKEDFCNAAPSRSSEVKQEWLFLGGRGHLNERGNELAAKSIYRFLSFGRTNAAVEKVADNSFVQRIVTRR